jgi:hypothetical protein
MESSAPTNGWTSVASSADGTRLVAAASFANSIYISSNSGLDWVQSSAPSLPGPLVACSASGTELVLASQSGPIYVSTDSGATWTSTGAPAQTWTAVTISSDGTQIAAVAPYLAVDASGPVGGRIYTLQLPLPPVASKPWLASLDIRLVGREARLSWLVPSTSFRLQQNSDLSTTNWTDVPTTLTLSFTDLHYEVNVPLSTGQGFYRLKQQ